MQCCTTDAPPRTVLYPCRSLASSLAYAHADHRLNRMLKHSMLSLRTPSLSLSAIPVTGFLSSRSTLPVCPAHMAFRLRYMRQRSEPRSTSAMRQLTLKKPAALAPAPCMMVLLPHQWSPHRSGKQSSPSSRLMLQFTSLSPTRFAVSRISRTLPGPARAQNYSLNCPSPLLAQMHGSNVTPLC